MTDSRTANGTAGETNTTAATATRPPRNTDDGTISFGVVLTPRGSGREWADQSRETESHGFTSILVPDTLWTVSPFPALAAAAAVTNTLRLRTWVIAAPLRSPTVVTRETSALQLLSTGRFELGIGSGRPDAEREAAQLGVHWGTAAQRISQVEQVIRAVRDKVRPVPHVVVAAAGPRMLAAAGRCADRIALALPPTATELDLTEAIQRARSAAPGPIKLSQQLTGLAGRLPSWLSGGGLDPDALEEAGAVGMLAGDPSEMADTLLLRSETLGIDEYIVPGELAEYFAPVISRMRN